METIGTVALVTGAARRVGRAIAIALANAGVDVAVISGVITVRYGGQIVEHGYGRWVGSSCCRCP